MSKAIEMQSTSKIQPQTSQDLLDAKMHARIQERAYQLYEARGRQPGRDMEDWITAEAEMLGRKNVHRAA